MSAEGKRSEAGVAVAQGVEALQITLTRSEKGAATIGELKLGEQTIEGIVGIRVERVAPRPNRDIRAVLVILDRQIDLLARVPCTGVVNERCRPDRTESSQKARSRPGRSEADSGVLDAADRRVK